MTTIGSASPFDDKKGGCKGFKKKDAAHSDKEKAVCQQLDDVQEAWDAKCKGAARARRLGLGAVAGVVVRTAAYLCVEAFEQMQVYSELDERYCGINPNSKKMEDDKCAAALARAQQVCEPALATCKVALAAKQRSENLLTKQAHSAACNPVYEGKSTSGIDPDGYILFIGKMINVRTVDAITTTTKAPWASE